jgi:hypothetical protein
MRFLLPLSSWLLGVLVLLSEASYASNCGHRLQTLAALRRALRVEYRATRDRGRESWKFDGITTLDFDRHFRSLLPPGGFSELFLHRRSNNHSNHILEVFGSAVFAPLELIDSATGVRILPLDPSLAPSEPAPLHKREEITENAFSLKTIAALRKRLEQLGVSGFDVIVVRPVGGLHIPSAVAPHEGVREAFATELAEQIRRYFQLLAPTGQMYLSNSLYYWNESGFEEWQRVLIESGAQVTYRGDLLIQRRTDLPAQRSDK